MEFLSLFDFFFQLNLNFGTEMMRIFAKASFLLLTVLILPAQEQNRYSPYTIDVYMGDFGFVPLRTEVEPKISSDDNKLLIQVKKLAVAEQPAAIQLLSNKLQGDPDCNAVFDFALATLQFQQGRLESSVQHYLGALKKYPSFLRARKNLAYVLIQKNDFGAASVSLAKSLELGDADGATYGMLGYCHLMQGRYSSAENAYRFALVRDPENKAVRNGLVRCLEAMGRFEETIAVLDELIRENPTDPAYWLTQVNSLNQLGEHRKAVANLEILRRMNQATGPALLLLGDLYLNLELPVRAYGAYKTALDLEGNLPPAHYIRAATHLTNQKAIEEAVVFTAEIQKKYGDLLEGADKLNFLNLRARLHLRKDEPVKATEILQTLVEQDPHNGEALILLGKTYRNIKNFDRAAIAFERAARTESHTVDALIEHARMLVEDSKYQAAAQLLRQAQEIHSRNDVDAYLQAVERAARSQSTLNN
jgi:tetratricopeptide (TPR) repeat protein